MAKYKLVCEWNIIIKESHKIFVRKKRSFFRHVLDLTLDGHSIFSVPLGPGYGKRSFLIDNYPVVLRWKNGKGLDVESIVLIADNTILAEFGNNKAAEWGKRWILWQYVPLYSIGWLCIGKMSQNRHYQGFSIMYFCLNSLLYPSIVIAILGTKDASVGSLVLFLLFLMGWVISFAHAHIKKNEINKELGIISKSAITSFPANAQGIPHLKAEQEMKRSPTNILVIKGSNIVNSSIQPEINQSKLHRNKQEATNYSLTNLQTASTIDAPMKTKILFLGANPSQTARLKLDEEIRNIQINLKLAKERDNLELQQEWAVTIDTLMQAILDESPRIVHFSGHGQQKGIVLLNEIGDPKLVSGEAIADLFKLFCDTIKCVILNSCYSEYQAQAIKLNIPYVIGMKAGIPDRAAISFSTGFYKAIGAGKDISFAFQFGITAIKLEGVLGDNIPILI